MHREVLIEKVIYWLPRICVAEAVAILGLIAAVIVLAVRPAERPFVAIVDHHRIVGVAYSFPGQLGPDVLDGIIQQRVEDFIYAAREVTPNVELQRRQTKTIYAMATGPAMTALDEYYQGRKDRDPILLANDGYSRTVAVSPPIHEQDLPHCWRVEWTETLHPPVGPAETSAWEAIVKVAVDDRNGDPLLDHESIHIVGFDMRERNPQATIIQEVHQ